MSNFVHLLNHFCIKYVYLYSICVHSLLILMPKISYLLPRKSQKKSPHEEIMGRPLYIVFRVCFYFPGHIFKGIYVTSTDSGKQNQRRLMLSRFEVPSRKNVQI